MANQYNPVPYDASAGLERNSAPQADADIRKLLKKILRQHKKKTDLLCTICFYMQRSYEREGSLGLDYATLSAMMFNLDPHGRKKKTRTSPNPWNLYDWR